MDSITPFDLVWNSHKFPEKIKKHPLQIEAINYFADLSNAGYWLDMGTGKTFCSTVVALYRKMTRPDHRAVIIMPPILLKQWDLWLKSIILPSGKVPTITCYKGTVKERKLLSLDSDFVIVSQRIFCIEYEKFRSHFLHLNYTTFIDEASMLRNIETKTHKLIYDFSVGHDQHSLSGTPSGKPLDSYGILKFSAPGTYRSYNQFYRTHVDTVDFYNQPVTYKNLDLLAENMAKNSRRILYEDMFPDTEVPFYDPIRYDLDPAHYKLYKKLAEEELLQLENGGKIDATTAGKLQHALGQIIVNWDHFAGEEGNVSEAAKLIEQKLEELGDKKLVVFASYKMTIRSLLKYFPGSVAINSEVSDADKQANLEKFKTDPKCRLIILNYLSAGKGLDGLQDVCYNCLWVEPCQQPGDFHQANARLKRLGQKYKVHIMMGVANGTNQVRAFNNLLNNDDTVNKIIRNANELRDVIFGGE